MDLARIPKRSVERVSASLNEAGEQLIMSVVRELPPRDSTGQLSVRVSCVKELTLKYSGEFGVSVRDMRGLIDQLKAPPGIRILTLLSVRALMTIPKADKLLLIFLASSSV